MTLRDPREPAGRVAGLWRYPVKSMGAEALDAADVGWHGLAGDRRWAFVRDAVAGSGFPWLTLRERGDLARFVPAFADPSRPDRSPLTVRTPEGAVFDIADPALAALLHPRAAPGARAIKLDRGAFDTFPVSLIGTGTIAALGRQVGRGLETARFRPNVLVDTGDEPFAEDRWVGRVLRIGALRLRVDKRDGRCVVITIDPVTGERDPRVLRTVVAEREGCLGVYASTVEPGRFARGDAVWVDD
jgi:uncharacterized protein YcbX